MLKKAHENQGKSMKKSNFVQKCPLYKMSEKYNFFVISQKCLKNTREWRRKYTYNALVCRKRL